MGIIKQANTALENQYIQAADAIKYLAEVEGSDVSYSDIAKFLLRAKFDREVAGLSYSKNLDGSFYGIDDDYDFETGSILPFSIDSHTKKPYSAKTRDFLTHVANYCTLEDEDMIPGFNKAFNLYWGTSTFLDKVKKILEIHSGERIYLPPVLETLVKIQERERKIIATAQVSALPQIPLANKESNAKTERTALQNTAPLALQYANRAFLKFWTNANPTEKDTQPTNASVEDWILEDAAGKISATMAKKIAQIIRPEWAAVGRMPES